MQHYVYVAWNVQTFGLCVPRFLQQVDILVLFIISKILADSVFWKEKKKGIMFSERKGIWLFLFSKKKKGFYFLKGKKKDFFCFKNSVVSISGEKKEKKIFTKPNKQVVCWFTKKEILVQSTRKGFEP